MTIDPRALVESTRVASNVTIHAFAYVAPDAVVGDSCHLGDHVVIESAAELGRSVRVGGGARIQQRAKIGDDVTIGANALVLADVVVGRNATIRSGAVVTRPVPPNGIVEGNPAALRGYVGGAVPETASPMASRIEQTRVRGASIHRLKVVDDMRGALTVGDVPADVPFVPKRFFVVYDVPFIEARGEHAHHRCHQFLICIHGQVSALVDDGNVRQEVLLDRPSIGLYVPPLVWGSQYGYSRDAKLLVFASEPYDGADYIRSYDEFLSVRRAQPSGR